MRIIKKFFKILIVLLLFLISFSNTTLFLLINSGLLLWLINKKLHFFQGKKRLIILSIASLLIIFTLAKTDHNTLEQNLPSSKRDYVLALAYGPNRSMDLNTAFDKISKVADVVLVNGNWDEWLKSDYYSQDISIARSKGMKIYVYLDLLSYEPAPREHIVIPDSLKVRGNFDNAEMREAYLNLVKTITQKTKPEYFVVLVESNLHKVSNPTSYAAYKDFYPQVYQAVKAINPTTRVAVSNVYVAHNDQEKQQFKQDVQDMDANSDLLAVSTYPIFLYTDNNLSPKPSQMPDTFLTELTTYSTHPLSIAETSWPSQSFNVPLLGPIPLTINTSPEDQADYVVRLAQSARVAQDQGKKVETINFIDLIDPPPASCALLRIQAPALEWFCSLALIDGNGHEKPAYKKLQQWKAH